MNFKVLLVALLFGAYLLVSHWVLADPVQHAQLGVALALAPPLIALVLFCLASGWHRLIAPLMAGVVVLIWQTSAWLSTHFSWLYFLQDAGTQLCLALMFGRTLLAGQRPLCGQIAALIHGGLDAALARYTRRATKAWTGFFLAMFTVSSLLFLFAPLTAWSAFSNLLVLPLTGLMFVAEYAVRLHCLPQRRSEMRFTDTFRAYSALQRSPAGDTTGER
ncbi:hypothetical protein QU481_02405 [Crenobacter sp. SG2303]|uniref:Transmembrane protein n=1 Tax=Crenobacter oryzisoli TaxID=3056844 RepID=A0ABT7XIY6_9NEIS|nr:hypothetical protein [Crenobacter sp. SG2303]MDN0073746.1 hypothetical protein [Crenobacter sp. SG2303]